MRVERIGDATLYLADCRDVAMPAANVIVYDPPFDLWATAPMVEAETVICFTNWQNREAVTGKFGRPRTEVVWFFRDGRWVSHNLPRVTHEYILVYGQTGSAYVGDENTLRAAKKGKGCVGRDQLGDRMYVPRERKQLESVMEFPRNVNSELGVWQKPLALVERLLEWQGGSGLVLDPFMGSGTVGIACAKMGRPYVGIECDPAHFEIARERIAGATAQGQLFTEAA